MLHRRAAWSSPLRQIFEPAVLISEHAGEVAVERVFVTATVKAP